MLTVSGAWVMSRKTSERRRAAFFRALAETGNQTVAAERAKVSRSWVSVHRAADPAFKAEMADAVAAAGERLCAAAEQVPEPGWRSIFGEELVLRGRRGGRVQVMRAPVREWSPRTEAAFLRTLGSTCNVKASCAEVGKSAASAYNRRNRWPRFAAQWEEALEAGFDTLEFALIANATAMLEGDPPVEYAEALPPMSVAQAIHLVELYKNKMYGMGRAAGLHRRNPIR